MCCKDTHDGFMVAFRGGQVLGFTLVGLALLILHLIIVTFKATWFDEQLAAISTTGECAG
jgi:Na+/H+-translocating membrane pyrophosphatase